MPVMPLIDPETQEWVFPNGSRIRIIAGGSVMSSDDTSGGGGGMEMDLEDDEPEERQPPDDEEEDDEKSREEDFVSRADHERIKSALRNERREKKRLRAEFEDKIRKLTSESTESSEIEVEKAKIQVKNERDNYWMEIVVRARAATEFAAQGASSTNAERLANMVDMKKVEYDEREREFDGLEEEIEDIIAENPEFFRRARDRDDEPPDKTSRVSRPRVEAATRGTRGGGAPRNKQSSAQILANRALRRQPHR